MKVKHLLAIWLLGLASTFTGAFFKLNSWEMAREILLTGSVVTILSMLLLAVKIFTMKEVQSFLNR